MALVTLPDGRKLEVKEYGPKTGRPVFVFHSTPGSLFDLELYGMSPERYAGGLGVRVICVNRPGYGRSGAWPLACVTHGRWQGEGGMTLHHGLPK